MKTGKVLGGVCLLVVFALALMMFFSKTIYYNNVANVSVAKPAQGSITKRDETTGVARWQQTRKIYGTIDGTIETLLIEEGGTVKEGQAVATIKHDTRTIEEQLYMLAYDEQSLKNDIVSTNAKIAYNQQLIAQEKSRAITVSAGTPTDTSLIEQRIQWAQEEYDRTQELVDGGFAPKVDADKALQALESVKSELAAAVAGNESQQRQASESYSTQVADRDSRISSYQQEIESLKLSLPSIDNSLERIAAQRAQYEAQLERYASNSTVYSPLDGTVQKLYVSLGEIVQENGLMADVGVAGTMLVEAELSNENKFTAAGDECTLEGTGDSIKGTITSITIKEDKRVMKIAIAAGDSANSGDGADGVGADGAGADGIVKPLSTSGAASNNNSSINIIEGEQFTVKLSKTRDDDTLLVPNSAVNKDVNGSFLYQVKERDGMLGKELYVEKLRVSVGEADEQNTEIRDGIKFIVPLVVSSDKAFADGDTVQVKNQEVLLAEN